MAKFNVEISEEVAKEFRIKVIKKYGILRGYVDGAVEEAMKEWAERNDT